MTCREITEFLSEYRSGELGSEQRARFERHLTSCRECVAYLRSFEETIRLAKGAFGHPEDALPADVPEALVRGILDSCKTR
jgi:anti-sigma factor RsiW